MDEDDSGEKMNECIAAELVVSFVDHETGVAYPSE
jgi:hypothetical protein